MAEALLKRIAAGDRNAVSLCLDAYGGLVWSVVRKFIGDRADAEDAVQEIFIDVWKNASRYDDAVASEDTFIAMIARRRVIDRIRHSSRRLSPASIEDVMVEPSVRADRELETNFEAREAAAAMRSLKPEQQEVLRLSVVQGMSHQEIATATGMPLGTVKTNARRGLIRIREVLGLEKNILEGGSLK